MTKDFFDELKNSGIEVTPEQKSMITKKLDSILSYEPRIGIFGKTGVGKSSLCNALFGEKICPISDVEACTRNPKEVILNLGKGIKLIDVPGVGESKERDIEYAKLYASLLPELDVVLWLLKADDRAYTSDETFYKEILKPHLDEGKVFFFVLNQVDKIEPFREWNEKKREPGVNQFSNIHKKIDSIAYRFGVTPSKIIPVSANEKYNLAKLVDEIVFALPREKKITIFRAISEENRSDIASEHVKSSFLEILGDIVTNVAYAASDLISAIIEKTPLRHLMNFFDLF